MLWNSLRAESLGLNDAWMVAEDFNVVSCVDEVSNPETFSLKRCLGMNLWIFEEQMIDPGFVGGKYTWMRGKEAGTFKGARLDRAVYTTRLLELFSNFKVKNLPAYNSDYTALLVSLEHKNRKITERFDF